MAITTARPTVIQQTQLGIESTYGTAVAATYRLPSLHLKPSPKAESMEYAMQGRSFAQVVAPNREWSATAVEGPMTYGELPVLWQSLLGVVSPVAGTGGNTAAQSWTHAPSLEAQDTPRIWTLRHGDATSAITTPGTFCTGVTLEMTRAEAKLTAELLGLPFVTAQSLTASGAVTKLEDVPILPGNIKWYADATYAGIGTTQLTRVLSSKIAITGRWQPEWAQDGGGVSFTQPVLAKPTASVELILEANSAAMAYFTQYRAGTIVYLQCKAISTLIIPSCAATVYSMALSIPAEIKEPTEYRDEAGVYAIGYTFALIADDTAGFPFQSFIWNGTTSI